MLPTTAPCRWVSARKAELAASLGADTVIDYTRTPLRSLQEKFDIILAINGNYSIFTYRKLLAPGGSCVMIGGSLAQIARFCLIGLLLSIGRRKLRMLAAKASAEDLAFVIKLVEQGRIWPVIDRRYSLMEAAEAYEYVKTGHAAGKVVINVIS